MRAALIRDGRVFLLNLGSGENRFTPDTVTELHTLLDEVEQAAPPAALVTCADGSTSATAWTWTGSPRTWPPDAPPCAVRRAEQLAGTAGPALGAIKQRMYAEVVHALRADRFELHQDRRTGGTR